MMQVADENGLDFLGFKLKIIEGKKTLRVYYKPTKSFTYVLPSTCYPYKNKWNIQKVFIWGHDASVTLTESIINHSVNMAIIL